MEAVAREQMITDHLPLVQRIVVRVTTSLPPGVDREDLRSAGVLGLIKAVDRFDPRRGVKFSTYATQVIRGEVMESLRARDWAPRGLRRRARALAAAIAALQTELGRPPRGEEVAERLGLNTQEYFALLSQISGTTVISLDETTESGLSGEADAVQELAIAEPESNPLEQLTRQERRDRLAQVVEALPEREKLVVALYYQENLSLREIGEILGVTESRICQIHGQAVRRLRKALAED